MEFKKDITQIAKIFWNEFQQNEKEIYNNIIMETPENDNIAISIIDKLKYNLGIQLFIGTYFKLSTRNCMKLNERKKCVEFIISPLFQKSNKPLLDTMYNEYLKIKLPKHWSIIKYKSNKPKFIQDAVLTYGDIEVTKDDFYYHPIINEQKNQLSIMIFIKDDKAPYLMKKEKINGGEIWVPNGNGIHSMLDSAIGEYNLINILDKIEIHLYSILNTKLYENIPNYSLQNIMNDINMIHNNSLSTFHNCSRCEYSNQHVKLYICKCKKTYYCDSICQRAHRDLHLLGGCV